jgi:hypothetical protein
MIINVRASCVKILTIFKLSTIYKIANVINVLLLSKCNNQIVYSLKRLVMVRIMCVLDLTSLALI